jgi:acetyltransferase-like isoleucine patch superfamily enzyme
VNINSCNNGYIEIGDNVMIGQNTVLRASDHIINDTNEKTSRQGHTGGKITIGNNVWIGANCVILKNVKIEDNAVIGAGTIVSKNINKNEVVVGNQQRTLKKNL